MTSRIHTQDKTLQIYFSYLSVFESFKPQVQWSLNFVLLFKADRIKGFIKAFGIELFTYEKTQSRIIYYLMFLSEKKV